jgi:hypothetical protein
VNDLTVFTPGLNQLNGFNFAADPPAHPANTHSIITTADMRIVLLAWVGRNTRISIPILIPKHLTDKQTYEKAHHQAPAALDLFRQNS